jgi:hypothetical protein
MKHLGSHYPVFDLLANVLHGLMETFPNVSQDFMMNYINSWPGIAGKLTESVIKNVRRSA